MTTLYLILHNIVSIISAIASCGMALFLFLNGKKKVLNISLGTTVVMVLVFTLSHVIGVNIVDPNLSRFVLMFNLSMFFIASTNVHAVLALIKKDKEEKWFIIFLYATASIFVIIFSIFPDLFLLPSVPKMYFPNYYVPGIFNWTRLVFLDFLAVPYMIYKLTDAYNKTDLEIEKNHYKYFIVIILVAYFIGFMPNFLVYNILIDPLWGMSFAAMFSIPFVYAGLKYELFNIKVVAKQAFYYALGIGLVGGLITLVNYSNDWIITFYPKYPSWITALISAILTVSVSGAIWKHLKKEDLLKYEFITTVTHKFRTPLTGIKWATENLETIDTSPEAFEQIQYIKSATEKLVELTDLIVKTSESERNSYVYHFTPNDISELTEKTIISLEKTIGMKKLNVIKNIKPNLITLYDETRIKFVIQIFIENAIHYTKENGTININLYRKDSDIIFSVHDTGIGMDKNGLSMVFSKFYRASEARAIDTEGIGIGLFIAKEVIKRHKGKIWAESEGIDKGSTFSFSLPILTNAK